MNREHRPAVRTILCSLAALGAVLAGGCHLGHRGRPMPPPCPAPAAGAVTEFPGPIQPAGFASEMPAGCDCDSPCAPPGTFPHAPHNEYLCDGGDSGLNAWVQPDWSIPGLEVEDTVAHFDTVEGRVVVEPSNRVCIYAPRFGTVRQVTGLTINEQVDGVGRVHTPLGPRGVDETNGAVSRQQIVSAERELGLRGPAAYRTRWGDGVLSQALSGQEFTDWFLPFEDLSIIRRGTYEAAEKALFAQSLQAAIVWSSDQAVQVLLNDQLANEVTGDRRAQAIHALEENPQASRLRVIKVASTDSALPGETVEFTIRFDNVGQADLGNVTLVDNLTTRLEYVADSAQCSKEATFSLTANEAQSHLLRWEIREPLKPGDGGIVRFHCKVR